MALSLKRGISVALVAATLALVPGWVAAWRAINRHEVHPVGEGVFEVVGMVGSGAADYWCGAGDYSRSVLGAPVVRRIYIWRAIGPSKARPGRKSVQFAFRAPEGAEVTPGVSLSVRGAGDNLTTAAAFQYCLHDDPQEPIWPFGW